MRIKVQNLGALRQAEFELGDLTIICGTNNTGKTYATYALFGFLKFWRQAFTIHIPEEKIRELMDVGSTSLDLNFYIRDASEIIRKGSKLYTSQLPSVFASSEKHFSESDFLVEVELSEIHPLSSYKQTMGSANAQLFSITKNPDTLNVTIALLVEKEMVKIPADLINRIIGDSLKEIIFGNVFPNPFIASAERTGAAIFRKELNFARNRLLEKIGSKQKDIDPFDLIQSVYSDYALPVKSNVEFTRQLEDVSKQESFVAKNHPSILDAFSDIIGGAYQVIKTGELYYIPNSDKRIKLTMDESSSSVRSLLDIGFYLRHVAKPGDLLMVDEPELNLHPENQRRVARLFARLVNIDIKIFITTHSDYIIKELNTLIMLDNGDSRLNEIATREGYTQDELISFDRIRVYIADKAPVLLEGGQRKSPNCQTLIRASINQQQGIEVPSFDKTIDDMNRIQEEIMWGGDE